MQKIFSSINKISLLSLVFMFTSICIANAQLLEIKPNEKTPWKSPSSVSLQSLVLPGAGYLYHDKLGLGYAVMSSEAILAGLGVYFINKEVNTSGRLASSIKEESDKNRSIAKTFFFVAGGIHIIQFVHSGILAHKSNKVNGYAKKDLDIKIYSKGIGAAVLLTF